MKAQLSFKRKLLIRENGKIIAETKNADANKLLIPASK